MLQPQTRWKVAEPRRREAEQLAEDIGISPLIAQLLLNRNIDTAEKARRFLNINETSFYDPYLMLGMKETVERIRTAIQYGERILVFGDYDADGVSSTAVMMTALEEIGAQADYYIPNRFTEGYGPNEGVLRQAKDEGVSLVITVDTGISAVNEAKAAKEIGLDFIITDHHQPPPVLPDAYSIINPHQKRCLYPFKGLSGAGVALKVAHALLDKVPEHLLDLAVLGTVADLVPLVEENRLLTVRGLCALRKSDKPGIRALLEIAGVQGRTLSAEDVGFALGPRLNAVGRLGSAEPAVRLLLAKNVDEAEALAQEIDQTNRDRKRLVDVITKEAIAEIEKHFPNEDNHVFVIAKEGWNPGVIGIVASRLVERYHRPTIMLGIDPETGLAKGSARSIDGFDIFRNLSLCRDLLSAFGGHPMAAGMTVHTENIDELRTRLNEQAAETLTADDFIPVNRIDLSCKISDISVDVIEDIGKLAPFGTANPTPKVVIEDAPLASVKQIGSERNHLKTVFIDDHAQLEAVGFRLGHLFHEITVSAKVSAVGELSINEWNGFRKPQLILEDLAVRDWQLFDCRNGRNLKEKLGSLPENKRLFVAFREGTMADPQFSGWADPFVSFVSGVSSGVIDLEGRYVVLLDLPYSKEQICDFFSGHTQPERIYAVFHHQDKHFFSTVPTREHFKWFYAFLLKRKTFDLKRYAHSLAEARGWSKETVTFMASVFSELEFITIEGGLISLRHEPAKRDLSDSATFREKQRQAELENDLCYSSYSSLKQSFEEMMTGSKRLEGALK